MKKKVVVILLTAAVLFTQMKQAPFVYNTEAKVVSREELELLKKSLQKEIDDYGKEPFDVGNLLFPVFKGGAKTDDYTYDCVEYDMTYEEAAVFSNQAQTLYGTEEDLNWNTEEYNTIKANGFEVVLDNPLSTFAADVDTGSYCNLRRMIEDGYGLEDIPDGAIRTEELLNYFDYEVKSISEGKFSVQYETSDCPWNDENKLLRMTIQANETDLESAGNNFVFLMDTSGSMDEAEKIALAKCSFKLLAYTLDEEDTVSIVTYAGDSWTVLEGCKGNEYKKICDALDEIVPYGGTNGSGGIEAAYQIAEKYFVENGNNRVLIASDGDMNLGITSQSGLVELITKEKESGVFLTTLGFGSGNYSDANMEAIADAGNGNYYYIDCLDEAQHILVDQQKKVTLTVAKDVKFQAEFNPGQIEEYRLLGYENREVADKDFENDQVDGGEVGAGQQVTILYEVKPAAKETASNPTDTKERDLKYQESTVLSSAAMSEEWLTLSINYKNPAEDTSKTEEFVIQETEGNLSEDMSLAISLAELSMIFHQDTEASEVDLEKVISYAEQSVGSDLYRMGYQLMLERLMKNK